MAAESSRSGGPTLTADSYIGSLISLTSKSEIRYEGILYDINTQESSIGLRNVRSFGTEGRKKDGPQIPASDKIYEYILFRGSDIKDLLVKSPPVDNASIHNDPAIIQSHYSHPSSSSTSLPTIGNGSVDDPSSHTAQLPRPTFQENLPLYHPGGSFINGSGLAMPMYWHSFYAPTGPSHLQQTPLFRPPHRMPLQYPGLNASLQTGTGSQNAPEIISPLFPPVSSAQSLTSTMFPSTVAPTQASILAPETASNLMANKPPLTSLPAPNFGANIPILPSPLTSNNDSLVAISQNMPSISSKPMAVTASTLGYQTLSQSVPSIVGSTVAPNFAYQTSTLGQAMSSVVNSSNSNIVESSVSSITSDQLLLPAPSSNPSSQSLQMSRKDVESKPQEATKKPTGSESFMQPPAKPKEAMEKPSASESFGQPSAKSNEPILPLPKPTYPKPNGSVVHNHHYNRGHGRGTGSGRGTGRGRGTGFSCSVAKFAEDFDFTAMNEKFNKDEVWDHLGKSKALSHDKEGVGKGDEEDDNFEDEDAESHKPEIKPVYVKDDFFDTLSCNTHNRDTRGGRARFSEQLKIDTETFGNFPRHRPNWGGRGGRGPRSGGGVQTRGSYYGRGNIGYVPRGRGHAIPNRAS